MDEVIHSTAQRRPNSDTPDAREAAERWGALVELSRSLAASAPEPQAVFDAVARRAAELFGDVCIIHSLADAQQQLKPVAVYLPASEGRTAVANAHCPISCLADDEFYGEVVRTGQPLVSSAEAFARATNVTALRYHGELEFAGSHHVLIVPLRARGRVSGTITLYRLASRHAYRPDDQTFLQDLADQAALAIEHIREIAERKRAEGALREAEDRFRLIAAHSPHTVFYQDRDLRYRWMINPAPGFNADMVVGKTDFDLRSREEAEAVTALKRHVLDTGVESRHEFRSCQGDQETFWEGLYEPRRDERGETIGVFGYVRNITVRKTLEQQLLQAQKMEAVGRLAGGIAHDFNNLLTVIAGFSELALLRLPPGEPLRGYVEQIVRAGEQAATLTRQLLTFSRRQAVALETLDLNAIVAAMEKMLRRLIGEDVELVTATAPVLGAVKADPGQVEQVLMNLAVNARDAMPHGGRMTIETENVELDAAYTRSHVGIDPGPYVMLAVSDTGTGMNAETMSHIFEPFFTTKEAGKGTGLGLATVYGIVKQSGGDIWVYSEPGRGTTFKIYLPRVVESASPTRVSTRPIGPNVGTETVLLVEDEEPVRSLIQRILRAYGYTVLSATSGQDALNLAARHPGPLHLLITDVAMLGLGGPELARAMAASRPEMRVLYMSGYTDRTAGDAAQFGPGATFLQKPFSLVTLTHKVRQALATRV